VEKIHFGNTKPYLNSIEQNLTDSIEIDQ